MKEEINNHLIDITKPGVQTIVDVEESRISNFENSQQEETENGKNQLNFDCWKIEFGKNVFFLSKMYNTDAVDDR